MSVWSGRWGKEASEVSKLLDCQWLPYGWEEKTGFENVKKRKAEMASKGYVALQGDFPGSGSVRVLSGSRCQIALWLR